MSRLTRTLLFLLLAVLTLPAPATAEESKKPFIVVFDFEEVYDEAKFGRWGKWGKWVGRNIRKKAVRRDKYQILDEITFKEVISDMGLKYSFDDPVEKFADIGENAFQANVIMWGKIEQLGKNKFKMSIRALDMRKSKTKLAVDDVHDVPSNKHFRLRLEDSMNRLEGEIIETAKRNEDLLDDDSWKQRPNLVTNPGFEEGDRWHPKAWEKPDGLSIFIVEGESPDGRCLLLDTDVPEPQYREWQEKFFKGAPATTAPKAKSTKLPGGRINYGTVGGTVGAHLYTDPIPIKPGVTYRFDMDFKGPKGNTKVFIKGYAMIKDSVTFGDFDREIYRTQLNVTAKTPGEWEHWSCLLHPTDAWVVYDFESTFDNGKTGRRIAEMIRRLADTTGLFPLVDADFMRKTVAKQQFRIPFDIPAFRIYKFTNEQLSAMVAVWGKIEKMENNYRVSIRALNIRKKQIRPYYDKQLDYLSIADMSKDMSGIIQAIGQGRPHVKYLRIKPDAYWPSGKYYFDNFALTEEGAYVYGKKKRAY